MDYFKVLIEYLDLCDDDHIVVEKFKEDINNYRTHSIRQYNNDEIRATDKFCLKSFLNFYDIAIRVFNLHSDLNKRKVFNRMISYGWQVYNEQIDDFGEGYMFNDMGDDYINESDIPGLF